MTVAAPAVPAVSDSLRNERFLKLADFARLHISWRASQLANRFGPDVDRSDIEQDMTIDLLERLPRYNDEKSRPTTFTRLVVTHEISRLVDQQSTMKRDIEREMISLNEPALCEGHEVEFSDTLDEQVNRSGRSREELHRLALDVAAILPTLRRDLQWLCKQIMAGKRLSQIERQSQRPRNKLRSMLEEIRRAFVGAAMDDHLQIRR